MPTVESLQISFSNQVSQGADAAAASLNRVADAAQAAGDAADQTDAKITRTTRSWDSWAKTGLDPAATSAAKVSAAQRQAQQQTDALNASLAQGKITMVEYVAGQDQIQQRLQERTQSSSGVKKSQDDLTVSTGNTSFAMRQLGVQSVQTFSSLATGMPIMTTLIQQGHQIVDVSLSTGAGLGTMARAFAGLLTPTVLVGAGVVAVAGGIALLGVNAESSQRQLLSLQDQLRATRDDYASMAAEATAAARAVASSTGASGSDTRAAAQTIVSVPSFQGTQQQLQSLLTVAKDMSLVFGTTLPNAAKELATAMQDPGKEAEKLAKESFPGMSQALATSIELQAKAGDTAGAFARDLQVLQAGTKGAHDNLTPLQEAMRNLDQSFTRTAQDGESFGKVLGDSIANAAAIAVNAIAAVVTAIDKAYSSATTHRPTPSPAVGGLNPTNPAGAGGQSGHVLLGPTQSDGQRAQGIFQLNPATVSGLGFGNAFAQTTAGNIDIGLTYLQLLAQKNGGSIQQILSQYGGFGTNTTAAQGYIQKVLSQNPANLPADTKSLIESIAPSSGLNPKYLTLAEQVALAESGGRQFVAAPAPIGPASAFPSPNAVSGSGSGGLINQQAAFQQRLDLANLAVSAGTLSGQRADIQAQIKNYTDLVSIVGQNTDAGKAYSEMIDQLHGKLNDLVPEQTKMAQAATDALQPLLAQSGAARDLAAVYQQFADAAKKSGQAINQTALNEALSDEQRKLAAAFNDTVTATNQATDATIAIGKAYDGTASSLDHAQNVQKAYSEALKDFIPGTDQFTEAVGRYADALDRSSQANRDLQQAQQSVSELANTFSQAFDQLGQGIVNSFLSGSGAAVNFGSIVKSVIASVLTDVAKMAVIAPIENSLFGTSNPTLGSALGALGNTGGTSSSGGIGGLFNDVSDVFQLSKIGHALGLTGSGGTGGFLSNVGNSLGLTGQNGLLSGVSGLLQTPIFGQAAATTNALTALGPGVFGPETAAQFGAAGGVTLGGALSGVGLGAGAGSLIASFLPHPQNGELGSVVGSAGGFGLGAATGLVGGPIGALVGGALGSLAGLFGPGPKNAFSSIGVGVNGSGDLTIGKVVSQIDDVSKDLAATQQAVGTINDFLQSNALSVTSLGSLSQIGQNTPGGFQDPSKFSDLNSAFPQLRFGTSATGDLGTALNNALGGQSFASMQDLQAKVTEITTFVNQTIPALTSQDKNLGSLATAIQQLHQQFDPAITEAQQLGLATDNLTNSLNKAVTAANDNANAALGATDTDLFNRFLTAQATVANNPTAALNASLAVFDAQAQSQRTAFSQQMIATYGDIITQTQGYQDQLAGLDRTLAEERLAITTQGNAQLVAAQKQEQDQAAQSATGAIQTIGDYLSKIELGSQSPLSPQSQYQLAQQQFGTQDQSALGGNFSALSSITQYADAFLQASQNVNGSGAQYVADFTSVLNALGAIGAQTPDQLTTTAMSSITATQTQTLVQSLASVQNAVKRIEDKMTLNSLAPSRIAG